MSAHSVRFTCTTLAGTGKKGVLPKDAAGYRVLPIGALNCFNSAGDFYTAVKAKELFERSSAFMRRVTSACLKSEEGHPKPLPGQSEDSYLRRILTIDEKNVCAHIADVWLDFSAVRDKNGNSVIAVMGKVKPAGPHGAALDASFENPNEDVCFSIRAFTEDRIVAGCRQRTLYDVVTFDRVTEPGIATSSKYHAPALESLVEAQVNREAIRRATTSLPGVVMESNIVTPNNLMRLLGLEDVRSRTPGYMGW